MANLKTMFTFILVASFCAVYSMPMDLLQAKSKRVRLNIEEYDIKPNVRIKKEMIKNGNCSKGMIYYLKQCRTIEEYEQLKESEDYDSYNFSTEPAYTTLEQEEGHNSETTQLETNLLHTENTNDYTTRSPVSEHDTSADKNINIDEVQQTDLLNTERTHDHHNTSNSNNVKSSTDTSVNKTVLLVGMLLVSFFVLVIWMISNLYYRHCRRTDTDADRSLPESTLKLLPPNKNTNDTTTSSSLQTSLLV